MRGQKKLVANVDCAWSTDLKDMVIGETLIVPPSMHIEQEIEHDQAIDNEGLLVQTRVGNAIPLLKSKG